MDIIVSNAPVSACKFDKLRRFVGAVIDLFGSLALTVEAGVHPGSESLWHREAAR